MAVGAEGDVDAEPDIIGGVDAEEMRASGSSAGLDICNPGCLREEWRYGEIVSLMGLRVKLSIIDYIHSHSSKARG